MGWVDISHAENFRLKHRGHLGMGCISAARGQGVGSKLMEQALAHAQNIGLEQVELSVYTTNRAAIRLYEKFGFVQVGLIKNYRKLDGRSFDCMNMIKFF